MKDPTKINLKIILSILAFLMAIQVSGQDSLSYLNIYPAGISFEYGIGNYSLKDENISKEKYVGKLPYFSIGWARKHNKYVYGLEMEYRNSDEIKNNNVSTNISQFTLTQSESAEYQILPENIGYVFLADFHENYLINEFPDIMKYLGNTKGLIIDIRQKRGGTPQKVEAVVSHFINLPLDWPLFHSLDILIDPIPFQPFGTTYTNSVVVLINGSTFSAGEFTTEMLKQLPNVTAVGDTTGGGGGASPNYSPETAGEFKLPSGKWISIPSGYIERFDGLTWEWLGIAPDIRVEQTEADIGNGRDKQLEYAINILKQ